MGNNCIVIKECLMGISGLLSIKECPMLAAVKLFW